MNIRICLAFLVLFAFKNDSHAQQWVVDSQQVNLSIKSIAIDPLSNRYLVTEEMQILKYKPDGSIWNRYENNRLGLIGHIDVTNPFQVLVFYPQYQILVILDNNLSETGRLNFNSIGFGNIRTAGISDDNNIWVLDEASRQLVKITTGGERKVEGIPYFGFNIATDMPIFIQQKLNYVYVSQEGQKIQVFDIFGKWIKSIEVEQFKSIVYIDKSLYINNGSQIIEYPLDQFNIVGDLDAIPINEMFSFAFDVVRNKFFGLNNDNQIIYFDKGK